MATFHAYLLMFNNCLPSWRRISFHFLSLSHWLATAINWHDGNRDKNSFSSLFFPPPSCGITTEKGVCDDDVQPRHKNTSVNCKSPALTYQLRKNTRHQPAINQQQQQREILLPFFLNVAEFSIFAFKIRFAAVSSIYVRTVTFTTDKDSPLLQHPKRYHRSLPTRPLASFQINQSIPIRNDFDIG